MSSMGRGLMCWKWVFIWFFYCKITCVVAMIIHQLLSVSHNQNICIPPLYKSFFYACAIKQRCCVLIKRKIEGKRTVKSFDLYFTGFFLFENRTQTLSKRNRISMSRIRSQLKCKTLIAKKIDKWCMNIVIYIPASRFFCITSFKFTYNASDVLWLCVYVNKCLNLYLDESFNLCYSIQTCNYIYTCMCMFVNCISGSGKFVF